jgi:hypothetical protein
MRFVFLIVFLLAPFFGIASRADDDPRGDLEAIRGQWEQVGRTGDGQNVRVVKDVKDDGTETVTTTDEAGNVLHAHAVEYSLRREGQVRVFTYRNLRVTDGPDRGHESKDEVSYVYRVVGRQFVEFHGVLESDPAPPGIVIWTRVKPRRSL